MLGWIRVEIGLGLGLGLGLAVPRALVQRQGQE